MEFFLEMLLTAVVALLFSFLVAKLVSASMAGNNGGGVNDRSSDQVEETEIGVVAEEELCSGLKMDATVVHSERRLGVVVDENVELVDRVGREDDRVVDEPEEATKGEDSVVTSDESLVDVSPENVVAEDMIVRGEDEQRDSAVRTVEDESTAPVSPENMKADGIMLLGQEVRNAEDVIGGEIEVAESVEFRVQESNTVEEKMELNTQGEDKEEEELSIEEEEDDDWEGIERSELEKAFATASNLLEESGKAEVIGDEARMDLYGLHKIATEGSCREAQPMAIMVSARAKWNAWKKLGNMSQEEAMEQYLALVSKEIPGLINNEGKMPALPPNSGSLEDPTTLGTTGVAFSQNGETN